MRLTTCQHDNDPPSGAATNQQTAQREWTRDQFDETTQPNSNASFWSNFDCTKASAKKTLSTRSFKDLLLFPPSRNQWQVIGLPWQRFMPVRCVHICDTYVIRATRVMRMRWRRGLHFATPKSWKRLTWHAKAKLNKKNKATTIPWWWEGILFT